MRVWIALGVLIAAAAGAAYWHVTKPQRQSARLERIWLANKDWQCCDTPRADACKAALLDLVALSREEGDVGIRARAMAKECPAYPEIDPATVNEPAVILCGVLPEPPAREAAVRTLRDQGKLWSTFAACSRFAAPFSTKAVLSVALQEWDQTCAQNACVDALVADWAPPELAGRAAQPHAAQVIAALSARTAPVNYTTELALLQRILGEDAPFAPLLLSVRHLTLRAMHDQPQYALALPEKAPGPLARIILGADTAAAKLAGFSLGTRELSPIEEGQALEARGMCDALVLFGKRLRLAEPERAEAAIEALVGCGEIVGELSRDAAALALTDAVVAALIREEGYDESLLRGRKGFVLISKDGEGSE